MLLLAARAFSERHRASCTRAASSWWQRPLHELGDVDHTDLVLPAPGPHRVVQHDHAERTGGGHHVGPCLKRLVSTLLVHPLADLLFEPHARAAGATAKAPLP